MNKRTLLRGIRSAISIRSSVLSDFQRTPSPLFMVWEATHACNLRCPSCYVGGAGNEGAAPLDTDDIRKIIRDSSRLGLFCLVITGGEPLLREDVFDVRAYASNLGLFVSLTTNGTLINDANIENVSKFDHVTISADSMHETSYEALDPGGRAYRRYIERVLRKLRERSPGTIVNVQAVIDGDTWTHLLDINRRFYDLGIDAVYQLRYGSGFHIERRRWETMIGDMRFRNRALGWIQKRSLRLFPAISRGVGTPPCLALTSNFVVSAEGYLLPCSFRREKIANLQGGDGLTETWKGLGRRRRKFSSKERGCACANTCFLPAAMLLA